MTNYFNSDRLILVFVFTYFVLSRYLTSFANEGDPQIGKPGAFQRPS